MTALLLIAGLVHLLSRALPAERIGGRRVADGLGVIAALAAAGGAASLISVSWAAACWAAGAAVVMLATLRFNPRLTYGVPALFSAVALLPLLAAALTLHSAPLPELRSGVDILVVAHAGLQAGGLALIAMALALAARDASLRPTAGLALGFALGAVILAIALAHGAPELGAGIHMPLRDATEAPLELHGARVIRGSVEFVAMTARDSTDAGSQHALLLILASLTALAGLLAPSRNGSRAMWALCALVAAVAAALIWGRVGAAPHLDADTVAAYTEALKVPPEQIVRPLQPNAAPPYHVHLSAALPACVGLAIVALIAAFRAAAPTAEAGSSLPERDRLRPGSLLGASRDAMMLAALLLWLGLGLGLFVGESTEGRFFTDHRLAGHIAVAVLASASVVGWHAAARRGSHRAFSVWVALPAVSLMLAALVMISGRLTGVPFHVMTVFP